MDFAQTPKRPILRVMVLIWADMLTTYVMFIMQTYLTNVWKLGVTHAAGIMNVANGLPKVLPLVFYYFVDAGIGHYWMLLLSSFSYVIGLGLLSLSTPPVLAKVTGTCKDYEPQCIGQVQKALFYTALALIAAGISGHIVSLVAFFVDQLAQEKAEKKPVEGKYYSHEIPSQSEINQLFREKMEKTPGGAKLDWNFLFPTPPPALAPVDDPKASDQPVDSSSEIDLIAFQFQPVEAIIELVDKKKVKVFQACLVVLFPVVGIIVLPYIKSWTLLFGIPAVCSLVATLAFLHGSGEYKKNISKGSPVTNVFRVIFASALNVFRRLLPRNSKVYEKNNNLGNRLLDKDAIEVGPGNKSSSWLFCTAAEAEEAKMVIRMIPIWITLILCGVVTSVGTTFFVEQANHMNYKVQNFKLPNSMLLVAYQTGKSQSSKMYTAIATKLGPKRKKYASPIGIALATMSAAICCVLAALVEERRLTVINDHGLVDKPDEEIPMTVFWILPQYLLLSVLDSFYENSVSPFLTEQCPPSMQRYLVFLNPGLSGMGMVGSISSVYAAGRISRRNGKLGWFQHNLNGSRLDRYYWTLAALSGVSLVWFGVWAWRYPYRDPTSSADEQKRVPAGDQVENGNVEHVEEIEGI